MKSDFTKFVFTALPSRVLFGSGRRYEVVEETRRLGGRRPLILTTREQATLGDEVAAQFDTGLFSRFADATMHTPWDVTARALKTVELEGCDCLVAVGGGSTIGLSKAIALQTDLPQVVIPTTYAGSEVTPIIGETRNGEKRTQRTLKVLPEVVIYDVDLTRTLPVPLSVASGLNAMAHAVEALYAQDANPITSIMAEEGIAALASAMPGIVDDPRSEHDREIAQYGAWLCGTCLGTVSMSLHHKICHVLGGTFNLPHAETHAVMIPHVTAYNAEAAPAAMTRIARAIGEHDAARGLYNLAKALGATTALKDIGMPENGLQRAAELVTQNVYPNPRPPEVGAIRHMLERAWHGLPPAAV
ncbi:maleylacetate reductase [Burkholderia cenocepacia]|uniref:maleylacetate reductase n=1 Tax=Burkholderia cenocepacia TaxID=95486 RepID=UPI001B935684|nr:maleylacetate reductase [Burkholderia cenocepacia]MBR8030141.1 maleylacetate reductase [Burkholderia cenocepacia]MBR8174019.1 maleylacetate reductase [Burkholderia cenocepacia]